MSEPSKTPATPDTPDPDPDSAALLAAMRAVLLPLARLALARGLRYQAGEELLKQVFVQAAGEAAGDPQAGAAAQRQVSRISTATGIHRREVTRLLQPATAAPAPPKSVAVEVFARWLGHGEPAALPRQGPAPSFEALARSVTRDVHPRSLLDELLRLGLAALDDATDTVRLVEKTFVPRGDQARLLGFLGDNVGDHLSAAVSNVVGAAPPHFEQAIFADELSAESMAAVRALVSRQWQALSAALLPALEKLIAEDAAAGRAQDHRLRVGLFEFNQAATPAPAALGSSAAPRRRRRPAPPKE